MRVNGNYKSGNEVNVVAKMESLETKYLSYGVNDVEMFYEKYQEYMTL